MYGKPFFYKEIPDYEHSLRDNSFNMFCYKLKCPQDSVSYGINLNFFGRWDFLNISLERG